LLDKDASVNYTLVLDSGSCAPHNEAQCFKSTAEWPKVNYPSSEVCKFHVEAKDSRFSVAGKAGDAQLYLEVMYENVEDPIFQENGAYYGDKFSTGKIILSPVTVAGSGTVSELLYPVYDRTTFEFTSDGTVEKEGWLVCLREKKKIPTTRYPIKCSDIGDDIWSLFALASEGADNDEIYVAVECDMSKCRKAAVKSVATALSSVFVRTTNVCDAGWKVARSSKFDLQFFSPRIEPGGTRSIESSFQVLAADIDELADEVENAVAAR